ncbi:MAG: ABC transporter substrate-binding protein [Treponema sp.]|nr:ABC transporter substrate-binding protein [Treponema sp.]
MKKIFVLLISSILAFSSCIAKHDISVNTGSIDFSSLNKTEHINLKYATQFSIDKYEDYALISLANNDTFLLVPQDKAIPINVPAQITVLQQPLDKTYLVSSAVMDFIAKIGATDCIKFSGIKECDWYIPEAVQAMKNGKIQYAGKYSSPDYELLMEKNCSLTIENTMIYHKPDVKEKLEELGIPVLVERSTYENHPLGKLEWIKLYGILFNKAKEAEEYYEKKISELESIMQSKNTGKSVAFFYVTSHGAINVRKPGDYISKIISLAGGTYTPEYIDIEEENALSTFNMQMEDFYASCINADIIIYNNNIAEDINSKQDLINKNNLFADFMAIKTGNAYSVGRQFFQESTAMSEFMQDIHTIVTDSKVPLKCMKKLD